MTIIIDKVKFITYNTIKAFRGTKTFECIDILLKIDEGYLFNYSEGESEVFTFDNWLTASDMKEFLFKNNDFKVSFGDLYAKR